MPKQISRDTQVYKDVQMIDRKEALKLLSCSNFVLNRLVKDGTFRAYYLGGKMAFKLVEFKEDLDKYLTPVEAESQAEAYSHLVKRKMGK